MSGYRPHALPFDEAVDADAHLLEPADVWEHGLESKFRERAVRIVVDDDGYEVLHAGGRPVLNSGRGILGLLGAMGQPDVQTGRARRYMETRPFGAGDASERRALLDDEHVSAAVLYPTLALMWEGTVSDAELTTALCRAYNRWIGDFCRDSRGQLVPIAHLSLIDPVAAARELERAVNDDGCRGAFLGLWTWTKKPFGHRDHDVLWQTAQDLEVPIAIHPTWEPPEWRDDRFEWTGLARQRTWYSTVLHRQHTEQALTTMMALGAFDRFPRLRFAVLESGAGWIGALLDRMDGLQATNQSGFAPLGDRPSEIFRRQCFISSDPEEHSTASIVDYVGRECFVWASDYPHPDHAGSWGASLEKLVDRMSIDARPLFLAGNARRLYGLS